MAAKPKEGFIELKDLEGGEKKKGVTIAPEVGGVDRVEPFPSPSTKDVRHRLKQYITPTQEAIVQAYGTRRSTATYYFWVTLYGFLVDFLNGKIHPNLLEILTQKWETDPNLFKAIESLVDGLKMAKEKWQGIVNQRQKKNESAVPEQELLLAEARVRASIAMMFDALDPKRKKHPAFERTFKWTRWFYTDKNGLPPPDKPKETSTVLPLNGRAQDACFWSRFFTETEVQVPLPRFCEAFLLHLQVVEGEGLEPEQIASVPTMLTSTLQLTTPGIVTLKDFSYFVQKYGPTLKKIYDHMCGVLSKKSKLCPWVTYEMSQQQIDNALGKKKQAAAKGGDDEEKEDENEGDAGEGDADDGDGDDGEEDNDEDTLKYMIRVSKEKHSFVLQFINEGKKANVYILLCDHGYYLKVEASKDPSKPSPAVVYFPTVRKLLMDYVCERLGYKKERAELLAEERIWAEAEEAEMKESEEDKQEEIRVGCERLGRYFKFRVHHFFDSARTFEEFNEALQRTLREDREPDAEEHRGRAGTERKSFANAERPAVVNENQLADADAFQKTFQEAWTKFPNWGMEELFQAQEGISAPLKEQVLVLIDTFKNRLKEIGTIQSASELQEILLGCLSNVHLKTFWFALWELDFDQEVIIKLLDLLVTFANVSNRQMNFNRPNAPYIRPLISSYWLRVASLGVFNKFEKRDATWITLLPQIAYSFGSFCYSDNTAISLATEYPLLGSLIDVLDTRDVSKFTLKELGLLIKGIRQMVDYLAVDEKKKFCQLSEEDVYFNEKFRSFRTRTRERGIAIVVEFPFLERLAKICLTKWREMLAFWTKKPDIRALSSLKSKAFTVKELNTESSKSLTKQQELFKPNFAGLDWQDCREELTVLTKEITSMIRLCFYSHYKSKLIIAQQNWLIEFLADILKLPMFEVNFEGDSTLSEEDESLRSAFDSLYMIADFLVRIDFPVRSQNKNLLKYLEERTTELYQDFEYRYRVVGTEVISPSGELFLYHFQLEHAPWLRDNTNVDDMRQNFVYQIEPEERGKGRQRNLAPPLMDTAEMYVHQYALAKAPKFVRFIADQDQTWSMLTILLIALINVILLPSAEMRSDGVYIYPAMARTIRVLGACHSVCSAFMIAAHFFDHFNYNLSRLKKKAPEVDFSIGGKEQKLGCLHLRSAMTRSFAYQFLYFGLSILGIPFPFLYCYSLVIAILSTELGQNLLNALGTAFKSLLVAWAMGMAFVYAFATCAFWVADLNGGYNFGDGDINWETLLGVTMGHFDKGMRGAPLWNNSPNETGREKLAWLYFLWSFIYNFVILMVLVAIIGGVVVDAFGQIRDKRDSQEESLSRKCLICGATREDLDEKFEQHVGVRHPLRNYLNLQIYILFTMDSDPLTADDSFDHFPIVHMVQNQIRSQSGDFLPSWQLNQDQLNKETMSVNIEQEVINITTELNNPFMWDIPFAPKPVTVKRTDSVKKRLERALAEVQAVVAEIKDHYH